MKLSELMSVNIVDLNMDVKTKKRAIRKIAKMLDDDDRINCKHGFIKDVYKREEMESTNMGVGIAIPHSKADAIKKSSVALARLKNAISWEDGGEKVKIIFLLAVSPNDEGVAHLEVISKVATLLMEDDFLDFLNNTDDAQKLIDEISRRI